MNTVYWVLVAFGIVVLEARLRARNVHYLPILPAIVLGAVLSKVTYVVLQWHYAFPHWGWGAFTVLRPDTFCFFGGAVGVVLGVIISAKLTHQRVLPRHGSCRPLLPRVSRRLGRPLAPVVAVPVRVRLFSPPPPAR